MSCASLSRLLLAALDRFKPPLDSAQAVHAARLLPRLAQLAGVAVEPVRTDYERTQALLALGQLLADCAQHGAQVLVLDDLQFADSASVAALRVLTEAVAHQHKPMRSLRQEPENDAQNNAYRIARGSIHAFGDQLAETIAEVQQAVQLAAAARDWPNILPALSNQGVMHYWRGEYSAAQQVLAQAREHRERLYGSSGSGIKIDIHLGAVLYEVGRVDEAQNMLVGAIAEMQRWPDNDYRRTECLLTDNHLAQMFIALGRADAAAQVLAHDASGVADRFYGRRLTLRLRWQRVFGSVDPARVAELQAVAARVPSPFNRALMTLELARQLPPQDAAAAFEALHNSPVASRGFATRPGGQRREFMSMFW